MRNIQFSNGLWAFHYSGILEATGTNDGEFYHLDALSPGHSKLKLEDIIGKCCIYTFGNAPWEKDHKQGIFSVQKGEVLEAHVRQKARSGETFDIVYRRHFKDPNRVLMNAYLYTQNPLNAFSKEQLLALENLLLREYLESRRSRPVVERLIKHFELSRMSVTSRILAMILANPEDIPNKLVAAVTNGSEAMVSRTKKKYANALEAVRKQHVAPQRSETDRNCDPEIDSLPPAEENYHVALAIVDWLGGGDRRKRIKQLRELGIFDQN